MFFAVYYPITITYHGTYDFGVLHLVFINYTLKLKFLTARLAILLSLIFTCNHFFFFLFCHLYNESINILLFLGLQLACKYCCSQRSKYHAQILFYFLDSKSNTHKPFIQLKRVRWERTSMQCWRCGPAESFTHATQDLNAKLPAASQNTGPASLTHMQCCARTWNSRRGEARWSYLVQ